jgi:hypothetical protein
MRHADAQPGLVRDLLFVRGELHVKLPAMMARKTATNVLLVVVGALTACGIEAVPGGVPSDEASLPDGRPPPSNASPAGASRLDGEADGTEPGEMATRGDAFAAVEPVDTVGGRYDIVVYGATAGGVMAAVAAAREGAHVALLEPGRHVGGMVSGGLGFTDFGNKAVIGGMSLGFFQRAGKKYNTTIAWTFEPHVAETIFQELLAAEANIDVRFGQRLRERTGVDKTGTSVDAMHMESGATYAARVFIDATYEGDLMAQAKVSYTWGREGTAQYGESLAGVREKTPLHQFTVDVSPFGANMRLLPLVQPGPKAATGSADRKVQAYNFRLCLTDTAANRLPFPRPAGYDPNRYTLLARLLAALIAKTGVAPTMAAVLKPDRIQNGKTDVNNRGAISTDDIGASWNYPEGDYATRQQIWQDHLAYTQGLLFFLANDPQVPAALRAEVRRWGPSKDEFVDTDHWPHQLYVREARRMIGEYVMRQSDIQTERTKPDSIGMGSYNSDSHNVERIPTKDGFVENEGDMQVPVQPYQIPFRMILPRRAEATNLLVPVAFSASHVAYSTLRMEPQYMIIGQATGIAAKMAIDAGSAVQLVDVLALQAKLRAKKVVLSLP